MRNRVLVGGIGRRWQPGGQQCRQALRAQLRAIHADQRPDRTDTRRRPLDRVEHVVGVDDDAGLMVGEVIFEIIGKPHVDQRRDRANAPARKQADQVVHAVVREDRHAIALAHAEMVKRTGEVLHGGNRLRECQARVAIDPAERDLVGLPGGPVEQGVVHQHAGNPRLRSSGHHSSSHSSE